MIKKTIIKIILPFQIIILYCSYYIFFLLRYYIPKITFVIGTYDVCKNIYLLKKVLKNSSTVCLNESKFYNLKYNYSIKNKNKLFKFIYIILFAPFLLGYLSNKANIFIYIWSEGFLLKRDFEFKFLKSINKKIVCLFVGDDIRSPKLQLELANTYKVDHFIKYLNIEFPYFSTEEYENKKKNLAKNADQYADVIFNFPKSQASYLKSDQYIWPYILEKKNFLKNNKKFQNIKEIKILHAPSSPLVKGTPLVRAAIKKLETEKYNFKYIEIINMPNEVVLNHLKSTHIVLNEFYDCAPGLFAIEGMAYHCAVLTSADANIETGLPLDSKDAWLVTRYWQIYDNLKYLLDNPKKIKFYADNGYEFVFKNYTCVAAREKIIKVLKEKNIIIY
jgi:hypothetical protein